jgi:translation initiation factor IF-3
MRERILSVLFLCGNSKVLNKEVATIAKTNDNQMINGAIKFPQVRLIDAEGQMIGVVPIEEALKSAEEADLDLVCISPNPDNPVCRVMDYNKFLFEKGKREKEAKKKQKETELKEVGLKLTTDVHDVEVKRKMVVKFLSAGDRVKVNIRFRGREMAHMNSSKYILDDFAEALTDCAVVEKAPKVEGRTMTMFLTEKRG